ncbi:hypothetical protein Scep_028063 [Stephania cephalantha]|uniref:Uncharacterized protein n=1 Tax=Stephania cephalantha TaxID=152367 RepID=A0AAP0HLQ5_9MAGN
MVPYDQLRHKQDGLLSRNLGRGHDMGMERKRNHYQGLTFDRAHDVVSVVPQPQSALLYAVVFRHLVLPKGVHLHHRLYISKGLFEVRLGITTIINRDRDQHRFKTHCQGLHFQLLLLSVDKKGTSNDSLKFGGTEPGDSLPSRLSIKAMTVAPFRIRLGCGSARLVILTAYADVASSDWTKKLLMTSWVVESPTRSGHWRQSESRTESAKI